MEINCAGGKWFDVEKVPESHIFGIEDRPGNASIPLCDSIPIIDLEREETVDKIIQASKEYGFFQVTNHGVGEDVIGEAVKVLEELFRRPADEISKEANANGWVYMGSTTFATKGAHLWRDNIKHPCHPLEESMQFWPQYPTRYREVVATYIEEIRRVSLRILEAISEGLGLEKGYLGEMSQAQFVTASHYPRCPEPSLTLGLRGHLDHSLITILFQGNVEGLQVIKDGKWMGVEVVPNAFLVNIGTQIQIISNGKLRSVEHRVVTNAKEGRTAIATFINPSPDCIIQPAKSMVDEANNNPSLYPSLSFKDFVNVSKPFGPFTQNIVPFTESVPESYIFGMEDRPGNEPIPVCKAIPVIDLANSHKQQILHQIIQASKEYGFFQVRNHGVDEEAVGEAAKVLEELFGRPAEEISKEANEQGWVYMSSTSFAPKGSYMWRDNLKHPCHPLEDCMQHWPQNPTRYREVVGRYIQGISRLSERLLELISEGLGLEKGYLGGMSQVQFLTAANYPACPDPSLTLGLVGHLDQSLITILFQGDVEGLQIMKDGKWVGVEVVPNAFLVNIGTQVQIISNGRLKSAEHRVVTNAKEGRTTIATFINPRPDCIIEPAKSLVDEANPPLYSSISFKEFVNHSKPYGPFTHSVQNV